MSKIAPHIAPYLQNNNSLNLAGFGTFTHDGFLETKNDSDDKTSQVSSIQFTYNTKVKTDENFVQYIKQETGKMIPLAIADIDTFINTGKQLLNISKPLTIDGLGSIVRSSTGEHTFTPGNFEPPKINTETVKERNNNISKEKAKNNELSYDTTYGNSVPKSKKMPKKILGAIVFAALLGTLGFVLYKYVFSKMMATSSDQTSSVTTKPTDTTKSKVIAPVVTAAKPDSLGRVDFKLVVRTTDSIGAYKRLNIFNNSKIDLLGFQSSTVIKNNVANNYQVVLLLKAKPTDTAAIRVKAKTAYGTEGQEAIYIQ